MAEPSMIRVDDSVAGRQIPWSEEAEISVLSAMLMDGDAVARAIEMVGDGSFYREANRRVFRAMVRLYSRGEVIDVVTLSDELKSAGELDGAGGMAYLARLVDAVPTAANIEYHCRILRDKSVLRQLIESATDIVRDAYDAPAGEVDDTLDRAEQRIFQIAQSSQRQGFVWIKEVLWPTFERIEELQSSPGSVTGVPSGFPDLDNLTAGFQKGDLIIVAGRPSMGKTALAMNFAQHAAIEREVPVAVFSLEMSKESLVQRLLCAEGRVDSGRLRRGRLQDDEYARLATAAGHLNTAPIWIDDTPAINALELRAKARRLASEVDLGLIIVDYLQLMSGPSNADNRQQEISAISRAIKAVAKELNVPVVALSQLSRAPEQRTDKRPVLADLRESGAIEQDADLVLFVYREEVYRRPEDLVNDAGDSIEGKTELIIGKQRNGPTGSVGLYFHKHYTLFESATRGSDPH
ncbi:MAG: replicative DNA helicase [Candidatus Palauibacterales bacterium]|nr:replicative DNA helicase [Candidatus Palauibacterales bacterium]MDP2482150.1 replicative DNA helicase [Candidatus Palauibacterales bacterium]